MKYIKPNFNEEWNEAIRYPEFEEMGKAKWIEFANQNHSISNFKKIKSHLNNVDLDYSSLDQSKKNRFEKAFKSGEIEIPIVVKFGNNHYDLVGGNTRIAGLVKKGIDPKLWVINLTGKEELSEKWSQKYKNSINCNNPKGFSQRAHCQGKKKMNESESLEGGLADDKSLIQMAKKHGAKGFYQIQDMVKSLKKQLHMGLGVEMEHTDDKKVAKEIAMDHLWEDPKYYTKLKQADVDEQTSASSSGAFSAPLFGTVRRKIDKIHNMNEQTAEIDEVTSASSSGAYDAPFGGGGPKGRKNPLKIDGPDSIYKGRAVKDKNFPKWGGPGGKFVKIKEKCKKFPYCNQGDINALELIESEEMIKAINETAAKRGLTTEIVKNIILKEIKEIFI